MLSFTSKGSPNTPPLKSYWYVVSSNNPSFSLSTVPINEKSIDDNAGDNEKVKNHFLNDAVDQLLQGNNVKVPKSESFGCKIFYRGIVDKMR